MTEWLKQKIASWLGEYAWIWVELGDAQIDEFLWSAGKWGVVGAFLGFWAGLFAFWGFRKWGVYRFDWRFARWLRVGWAILTILVTSVLGASIGALHGIEVGYFRVIQMSRLGREYLPMAGQVGADLIAAYYSLAPRVASLKTKEDWAYPAAEVVLFHQGLLALEVSELHARTAQLTDEMMQKLAQLELERSVANYPELRDPRVMKLANWAVAQLYEHQIKKKISETADKFHVREPFEEWVNGLTAAARTRAPNTALDRMELASHIVDGALMPALTKPVSRVVRSQQVVAVAAGLAFLGFGALLFHGLRVIQHRRAQREEVSH